MQRILFVLAIAFFTGCAGSAGTGKSAAEAASLINREAIFGNPQRTQGRISPDGRHLSWIAPKDGVLNVWVAPAAAPDQAVAVTGDTYRGIRLHYWAPNSAYIYYVQDQGGDENFHVYASDISTGEVRDLTPVAPGARASIQALSRDKPDYILVGLNERDPQYVDLYLVDVRSGERTLVAENPGYASWIVDHSLTPRFGVIQSPGGVSRVVDMQGKQLTTIPAEDFMITSAVGFNATNDRIYIIDSRGRNTAALVSVSAEDGSVEVIASDPRADINNVLLHPTTREPLAYSSEYLRARWHALDPAAAKDLQFLESQLEGDIQITATTDDLSRMVVHAESATAPGVYYLYDREQQALTPMFATRPELEGAPLQAMWPVEIPARDGLTLVSYLTLPPGSDSDGDGRPEQPVPLVLAVHGGPWVRDSYGYNSWHQWLANRGYAVLSVNYRGSTGFGKDFVNAAIHEFSGKMHDDLIDGVDWAINAGITRPDTVAIAGGSYGGYATLIGVTFTPDRFACGVDLVGPSSLVTLVESFPEYWKPLLEGSWYKFVGNPEVAADRADMLSRSAISRVDHIRAPLLIGQGENDPRVTKLESDQLVATMEEKGLPVTYVNFPDEGHGFARPENRLAFYAVMEGFLAHECLGGRAQPVENDFEGSTIEVLAGAENVKGLADALARSEGK
ncbi:S9 family peptidase [Haliea sp. E17]|uniref:S9 family peptidase n=1 Tax=Haliea sp. E17 TaxID=3401576 RepID=UPI003AAA8EA5